MSARNEWSAHTSLAGLWLQLEQGITSIWQWSLTIWKMLSQYKILASFFCSGRRRLVPCGPSPPGGHKSPIDVRRGRWFPGEGWPHSLSSGHSQQLGFSFKSCWKWISMGPLGIWEKHSNIYIHSNLCELVRIRAASLGWHQIVIDLFLCF